MKPALIGVLLLAALACSRTDTTKPDGAETGRVTAPAPHDSNATGSAASGPAGVPRAFEDPDEAAAHQITEQNLESELDRLEREIQAE